MKPVTEAFLKELDEKAELLKTKILNAEDRMEITGVAYYVANDGDDSQDGKTPQTAWKTLAKVGAAFSK